MSTLPFCCEINWWLVCGRRWPAERVGPPMRGAPNGNGAPTRRCRGRRAFVRL